MRSSFFLLLLIAPAVFGQVDTNAIQRIYYRASHFTEARTDSIGYYADYINHIYLKGKYPEAKVMALSLYGYYFENKADYKRAIDYYLQALEESRRLGDVASQVKCLTDLAAVYTQDMKQPQKAKEGLS